MMGEVILRTAVGGDAGRIASIHVESWQSAYRDILPDAYLDTLSVDQRLPMWERILGHDPGQAQVWVAEIKGEIVGFCSFGPDQADADRFGAFILHLIYVHPDRERRGIGRRLIERAEHEMRTLGAESAILWVLDENHRAQQFYAAMGWTPDGTERTDELWGQTVHEVRFSKRLASFRTESQSHERGSP